MANTHTLIHTHAHMHTHTCTRTHTHNEWKSHINQSFQTSVCDQTDKPIVLKTESGGRGTQGCPGASSACCPPHLPWTAGSSQSLWSPGGGCLEEAAWRSGRGRPPAGWVLYQCPPRKATAAFLLGSLFQGPGSVPLHPPCPHPPGPIRGPEAAAPAETPFSCQRVTRVSAVLWAPLPPRQPVYTRQPVPGSPSEGTPSVSSISVLTGPEGLGGNANNCFSALCIHST